jgi:hypothetical protein
MTTRISKTSDAIPENVRTLADACSIHFRASSRLWTVAATLTLIVFNAKASEGTVKILGFEMDSAYLYPVCASLLAIINVAYCSAHLQAYRITLMYHDLLESLGAKNIDFSPHFSIADAAHTLYIPALNRVYPLTHFVPKRIRRIVYVLIKLPTDFLFYSVPTVGCLFALSRTEWEWEWALLPLLIIVLASVGASLILLTQGLRWILVGPAKMTKRTPDD